MADKDDEAALQSLLGNAVRTLFQQTVNYSNSLSVEGVLGLRIDDDRLLLLKVDEKITALDEVVAGTGSEATVDADNPSLDADKSNSSGVREQCQPDAQEEIADDNNDDNNGSNLGDDGRDDNGNNDDDLKDASHQSDQSAQCTETMTISAGDEQCTFTYIIEEADKEASLKIQQFKTDGYTIGDSESSKKRKRLHRDSKALHPLNCTKCSFVTLKAFAMKQHLVAKHGTSGNVCVACEKCFTTPLSLQQHRKLYHPKDKAGGTVCHECNKQFSTRLACRTHIASQHEGLSYSCPYCNTLFKYKATAARHMKKCKSMPTDTTHQQETTSATTLVQQQILDESSGVVYNIVTSPPVTVAAKQQMVNETEILAPEPLVHEKTGLPSSTISQEIVIQEAHVAEETQEPELSTTETVMASATKTRRRKQKTDLKCHLCLRDFPTMSALKIHMQHTHVKAEPLECSVCGATFKLRSGFHRHKRRCCPDAKEPPQDSSSSEFAKEWVYGSSVSTSKCKVYKFSCDICQQRFTRKDSLRDHVQGFHSQTKQYICSVCEQKFKYRGMLAKHRKQNECGTQTVESSPKKAAKKVVVIPAAMVKQHKKRGRKPILSKVNTPSLQAALEDHLQESASYDHKEPVFVYKCSLCDKRMTRKGSLQDHMRAAHMGFKPFSCSQCGESFKYRTFLTKHRKQTGCALPVPKKKGVKVDHKSAGDQSLEAAASEQLPASQAHTLTDEVQFLCNSSGEQSDVPEEEARVVLYSADDMSTPTSHTFIEGGTQYYIVQDTQHEILLQSEEQTI